MTRMTTAELRGYQQICGPNGTIMVIACDQRGGIRKILGKTPDELLSTKVAAAPAAKGSTDRQKR